MGGFRLEVKRRALKGIEEFREYRERLTELLTVLKQNPVPFREFDVAKLKGFRDAYRVRLGKLRVIYKVDWSQRVITILVVAERSRAHDRM